MLQLAKLEDLPPATEAPRKLSGWSPSLLAGLWTWLAGLVAYAAVTYLVWIPFYKIESKAGPRPGSFTEVLSLWQRWDTNWYTIIATRGYGYDAAHTTAFFPLYPASVRAANLVLPGGALVAGLVVSGVCAYAALVLLHRLALDVLGDEAGARRAAFYVLAFPAGFFLMAAYNESMFIALATASLYGMRRGHWWAAGGLAALASATRSTGVLLAAAFAYEYLRRWQPRRLRWDAAAILLVPLGILAYAGYCWHRFGDPLIFLSAQENWHRTETVPPWETLANAGDLLIRQSTIFTHDSVHGIMNLAAALGTITVLVLALVGPWKLGKENAYLVVYAFPSALVPLLVPLQTTYPLGSMLRFVIEYVPVFLVLAKMGRNANFDRLFVITAVAVQSVLLVAFLHNQFVA
ncbi:mannosyltransferase family protein [Rhizocola hellebori]|uniref:mannosyltransferase family protein n=1 Tax=Rhizocola hellebori TaxID=1392758 RepID=UPI00194541DE|nr:mannosyltransferase family protein [Rhizocola hellebori]